LDWIVPASEEHSFARDVTGIWAGRWVVLIAVLAALAGAAVYLSTASKVYEAHSQLLITPLPDNSSVSGLGLILQSSDPLRDVETASGFVTTTRVAQRVIQSLGLHESAVGLLNSVKVAPIAESNIVDIGVDAGSAAAAQRLANAFATQTVSERAANLANQLSILIPRLKQQITAVGPGNAATKAPLSAQLAELETLRAGPNPELRVAATAGVPTSPVSPRKTLTLAAALAGGLIGGVGLVFLTQLLDPRLRREEELRERFRLPVLARIPRLGRRYWLPRRRGGAIAPAAVSPQAADAYRTLRAALTATTTSGGLGARTVLVTGGSPLDGKSTTAINLAAALASSGEQVVLVEGDERRPSIGRALHVAAPETPEGVREGQSDIPDLSALQGIVIDPEVPELRVLLASQQVQPVKARSPAAWTKLLQNVRRGVDWVVVDAPPLIYAPDLLSAAELFDDVLLVARLGNTNVRNLEETAELLAQHGIRPAGLVVVGTTAHRSYY
jgi:Mrp family chromosome partitioning ATPase/capsular polysaccharide biosynthesis protein